MPTAFTLPLRLTRTLSQAGGEPQRALNALFYHWLEAADPKLARFVHDEAEPKPFTLSALQDDGDGHYHFRVTLLEDEYAPYISAGMAHERTVRIGAQIFALAGEPQVVQRAYRTLFEGAPAAHTVGLRFVSPTSFSVNDMDYLLPDPRRVFQSYLLRWNAFAGAPLEPAEAYLEWVQTHVALSRFELKSETLKFRSHVQIGFVGEAQYVAARRAAGDAELVRWLNRLAGYAEFCGTGHKVTQGMGQTQLLL